MSQLGKVLGTAIEKMEEVRKATGFSGKDWPEDSQQQGQCDKTAVISGRFLLKAIPSSEVRRTD